MKLVFSKGMPVEQMLDQLSFFLRENYGEYGRLKNAMNIYVTLADDEFRACPDNDGGYYEFDGRQMVDVRKLRCENAVARLQAAWKQFVMLRRVEVSKMRVKVARSKSKKRREEDVLRLEMLESQQVLIGLLDACVEQGSAEIKYFRMDGASPYDYSVEAFFVFNGIEGFNGYFDGLQLCSGSPYVV